MKIFVVCLLATLMSIPALGQWEYGGKVVGQDIPGYTDDLAVANLGGGSIIVAWNGLDNGNYAIFAQRLDSAGLAIWPVGGQVVCEGAGSRQHYPAVLPDGDGGAFVVWSDWRHTWAQGVALYGQHIDALGNKLWDSLGVRLTADTFSQGSPQLFDDGQGGFIAVFETSHYQVDIGAQRVNRDGQVLWDSTGIFLTHALDDQYYPKTCRANDSSFITIWIDLRNYLDTGLDIYMQKFNLAGRLLWDPNGIPAVNWSSDQGYLKNGHDIAPDGYGGCVVVWKDWRTSPPGHGALYANRYSPSGQYLWANQGKDLGNGHGGDALECQAYYIRQSNSVAFRWGDSAFKISHLDMDGNFIGQEIIPLDTFYTKLVFYDSLDGTFKYGIYNFEIPGLIGRKCDIGGQQFWPNYPFLSNDIQSGNVEKIASDGFGGMIFTWMQSSYPNIRITRIHSDGYVGGDTTDVNDVGISLPTAVELLGNYPNPFNSETIVRFAAVSEKKTMIEVFNILGQKIFQSPLMETKGGESRFRLNLTEYSSGTYFLRMTTEGVYSKVMPVTLLK